MRTPGETLAAIEILQKVVGPSPSAVQWAATLEVITEAMAMANESIAKLTASRAEAIASGDREFAEKLTARAQLDAAHAETEEAVALLAEAFPFVGRTGAPAFLVSRIAAYLECSPPTASGEGPSLQSFKP